MKLQEYGFWEYTCPNAGQACFYRTADWGRLLDDMAEGGMNSLAMVIKHCATGYKSRLPWLDQDPSCAIIASKNQILNQVLRLAKARKILVWLVAVCSHHQVKEFGIVPPTGQQGSSFFYDPDYPGVLERIVAMFEEIAELSGDAHGIVVEMESVEFDWPHRIPLYNEWAKQHGRPCYAELKLLPLDARAYRIHAWRDFLTWRRCVAYQAIEKGIRATGYRGKLATICETCNETGSSHQALNLAEFKKALPRWAAVTYEYDRTLNPLACVDFCMLQPKAVGLATYYLGRGVMTCGPDLAITLEENWRRDLADVVKYGVDGFWFFGTDAVKGDNVHCNEKKLRRMGFTSGLSARKKLLQIGKEMLPRR
ncbi:MAG: hypothetical protein HY360_25175 [Verrucomicrobia bacterium]|nr:hypothetical protein [Verrucomicrobiota bacterium]